jgi:hypothetical protein
MMNRRNTWSMAVVAAVVLLVPGGLVLISGSVAGQKGARLSDGYEVVHEVAGHQPEQLTVPTTVSEAAWVWEGPGHSELVEILPVSTGAVLNLSDGAVGIDPRAGEEVWNYRLLESEAEVAVSPDRSLVAVSAGGSLVLLDSGTGERLHVIEHGETATGHLSLQGAGLVADEGLVVAGGGKPDGISASFKPWEGGSGWINEDLRCTESSGSSEIKDGFLTPSGVVVVYQCGASPSQMASLDLETGEEQWRLVSGDGFDNGYEHDEMIEEESFAVVGDVAVLQNMARLRGSVAIDTRNGEVLSDSLPSESGNEVLRVLSDGYLAVRTEPVRDEEWEVRFEVRDFSGEVRKTVVTDLSRGTLYGLLPLEDSFLKLSWSESDQNSELAVFGWGDEGSEEVIDLPVSVEWEEMSSVWRIEEAVGPGAFQEVPGAVLLREYPNSGLAARVVGLT